jgi:3-phenylpropionate/trans-cinnamate dioxygenase ferredoxin subunit
MRFPLATLRVGQQRCVNFEARSVLVCRTAGGIFAIENKCPHAEFPLAGGKLVEDTIRCPTHGAKFDLHTGKPLTNPRLGSVKAYKTEIDGDFVTLSLPDCGPDCGPDFGPDCGPDHGQDHV